MGTVEWDYLAVMMYTSWFVEAGGSIGIDWDTAHYMAYDYALDLKRIWGDRAAIALGVTNPGEGQGTVVYSTPEQMAPAVAAVKAAGMENVGIYDLKVILESDDPESWFKMLTATEPAVPEKGRRSAKRTRKLFKAVGRLLDLAGK